MNYLLAHSLKCIGSSMYRYMFAVKIPQSSKDSRIYISLISIFLLYCTYYHKLIFRSKINAKMYHFSTGARSILDKTQIINFFFFEQKNLNINEKITF